MFYSLSPRRAADTENSDSLKEVKEIQEKTFRFLSFMSSSITEVETCNVCWKKIVAAVPLDLPRRYYCN